ncbi:TPA: hypothetical protein J1A37_005074 [Escherichia coli]|nr:hypothetical protein [Escherichia coli]HBB0780418.1 hypothetical protein [Escherichia coli]
MKRKHAVFTPVAFLVINSIGFNSVYSATPVSCSTTGTSENDLFCGAGANTSGSVKSIAIGNNALVSKNASAGLAVGYNSKSAAQNAIAIGNSAIASAANTISIGSDNSFTTGSVAIGTNARAGREDILSLKDAGKSERTWIGKQNNIALGVGSVADGGRVISIGENAGSGTIDNWNIQNINIGTNAGSQAKRDYSVALGFEAGMVLSGSQDATEDSKRAPSINIGKQAGKNTVSYGNISVGDNAGTEITDNRSVSKEGANKQVISSQADSLIKISRIWADFFPANTSNQPI